MDMGAGTSKQRLGERVKSTQKKLDAIKKVQAERTERIKAPLRVSVDIIRRCEATSTPILIQKQWQCARCTLLNEVEDMRCSVWDVLSVDAFVRRCRRP